MRIQLHSKASFAEIDTLGAQLVSFSDAEGIQYLWQGNAEYWSGQSPILFPIVGALRDGKTTIDGKEYSMGRHGFARKMEFCCVMTTDDSATFSLNSNEETHKQYSFDFQLMVTYRLNDCTLTIEYMVMNMGDKPMPFVVGGHPAFNCPILSGEQFENYVVEFETKETADCPQIDLKTGLIDFSNTTRCLSDEKTISLQHSLFYKDALVFDHPKSSKVKLCSRLSGRGVEMNFKGFDYLGVWSAINDAPFVALEPWTGCATSTDEDDLMIHKRGMKILDPNQSAKYSYSITIL